MRTIKAFAGVAVVVAVVVVAFKLIPIYMASYQFQDQLQSISRLAAYAYAFRTEDDIRHAVEEQVKQIGVPVKSDNIHILRQGNSVTIWTDYTVHVDLPAHPMDLDFHPAARNGEKVESSALPQNQ